MQSLCEVCRRKQGARNVSFFMEFVPKGEPEGCEWRGRERGSAPRRDGKGQQSLLQKETVVVLGLMTWLSDCLWGKS
jgi:hypothetical protein